MAIKKIKLTSEQYNVLVERLSNEINKPQINEGVWEKVKYGLSKLGRYKADGKILGKGETDKKAMAQIQSIIDKKGNELIKSLDANIKQTNPEFPNNEKSNDFLNTILEISAVYDSIIESVNKGDMPIDAANGIINDLREYVKKFLDVDLTAAYSVVDENEMKKLDEAWQLNEDPDWSKQSGLFTNIGKKLGGLNKSKQPTPSNQNQNTNQQGTPPNSSNQNSKQQPSDLNANDVRSKLQAKGPTNGKGFASTRMDTLKSNKLPLSLVSVGSALGGLSWIANTEWFKHLFDEKFDYTDIKQWKSVIEKKTEGFLNIKPDKGLYSIMSQVSGHRINGYSNPTEFVEVLKQIGGGDAEKGVDLLCQKGGVMMRPQEASKILHKFLQNPNEHKYLDYLLRAGTPQQGTGKLSPINTTSLGTWDGRKLRAILIEKIPIIITKRIVTHGVKTGATYFALKGLAGILGPIGVAAIGTGALVKLMRMKGQKQSRAKTLNDLYQSLKDVESTGNDNIPNNDNNTSKGNGIDDDLYNSIKNLFKFIVNNRKFLGNRSADNVGSNNLVSEAKYITDKRLIAFLNKNLSADKLKLFEELINRVEVIRNKVRKINPNGDKAIQNFINDYNSNPIIMTDFKKLFNVDSNNPQAVNSLKAFIDDLFITIYSSKFKYANMIDNIAGIGGNINKLDEEKAYNAVEPNKSFVKDAQERKGFKNNLVNFIGTTINLFNYLIKLRKNGGIQQNKQNKPKQRPSSNNQTQNVNTNQTDIDDDENIGSSTTSTTQPQFSNTNTSSKKTQSKGNTTMSSTGTKGKSNTTGNGSYYFGKPTTSSNKKQSKGNSTMSSTGPNFKK
jgi:hypothetical protein